MFLLNRSYFINNHYFVKNEIKTGGLDFRLYDDSDLNIFLKGIPWK